MNKITLCKRFCDTLTQHGYNDDDVIEFAKCLQMSLFNLEKFNNLMRQTTQVCFNFNPNTKQFELIDPFDLMNMENKKIVLSNFAVQIPSE